MKQSQKEYILTFFKDEEHAGWKSIAEKLIENGTCIVVGSDCIWKGGVGNFITTKETDLAVGCLEYTFDLPNFISSLWFMENLSYKVEELREEMQQKVDEYNDLKQLAI